MLGALELLPKAIVSRIAGPSSQTLLEMTRETHRHVRNCLAILIL